MTRREQIAELLRQRPWTPKELAEHFKAGINEITIDLAHVKFSTKPPLFFESEPAKCFNCGFVFKERERIKAPSKCPKCKEERISDPKYLIREG